MTEVVAPANAKELKLYAVVTRCGCATEAVADATHVWSFAADGSAVKGVCPNPRQVENKGLIAYWHRNWFKRNYVFFVARLRGKKLGNVNPKFTKEA